MPPTPFPTPFLPLRRRHLCLGTVLAPACTAPEVEVSDRTHLRLTTSPKQSGITTSPTAEHTTIITAGGIQEAVTGACSPMIRVFCHFARIKMRAPTLFQGLANESAISSTADLDDMLFIQGGAEDIGGDRQGQRFISCGTYQLIRWKAS